MGSGKPQQNELLHFVAIAISKGTNQMAMIGRSAASTILSLFLSSSLYAQYDGDEEALYGIYGDEEIISIATGTQQPVAKAPAVASVITARQILDMGATDLDDILETVPGLHVSRGQFGYASVYIFRGIYSPYNPQVLVLINGIPLTALFQGDRNLIWGGMPVNAISRVEVIRGPGSALYGADAFAGVINIITKTGTEIDALETGLRSGSFGTRDAWVLHGSQVGQGKMGVMLEYHKTNGQNEIIEADAQTQLDAEKGTSASLAPGPVNLSQDNLDLRLDYEVGRWQLRAGLQRRADIGSGAGILGALDPNNRYRSERWNSDISYHNKDLASDWDIVAQVSVLNTSQEIEENLIIYPPGADVGFGIMPDGMIGNPEVYERHSRAEFSGLYTGFDLHQIRVGAGYYYGDMYKTRETKNYGIDPATGTPLPAGSGLVDVSDTAYVFLSEDSRDNTHVFLQDIWNIAADWEMTAGVRYDDYSDFGATTNPRLALVWASTHNITTKLLYGKSFRSPSFAQTREKNNPVDLGNPNLDPETIESLELAFSYRFTDELRLDLNLFTYQWDDIIQYVSDQNGANTRTAQNAGKQIGKGGEFELNWDPLNTLTLNASIAIQNSEDKTTRSAPPQSPRAQLYAAALWSLPANWKLHFQINNVMDRRRLEYDSRSAPDDYTMSDLTLRRHPDGSGLGYALAIRNMFDSNAREPSEWAVPVATIPDDLPLAGRSYFVEVNYRFQ